MMGSPPTKFLVGFDLVQWLRIMPENYLLQTPDFLDVE
jgi:hypothetical protein